MFNAQPAAVGRERPVGQAVGAPGFIHPQLPQAPRAAMPGLTFPAVVSPAPQGVPRGGARFPVSDNTGPFRKGPGRRFKTILRGLKQKVRGLMTPAPQNALNALKAGHHET